MIQNIIPVGEKDQTLRYVIKPSYNDCVIIFIDLFGLKHELAILRSEFFTVEINAFKIKTGDLSILLDARI